MRQWGGFAALRAKPKLLGAGVLFEKPNTPNGTLTQVLNPELRRSAFYLPLGNERVRGYLMYEPWQMDRLQGAEKLHRFIDESVKTGLSREFFDGIRLVGPLASFDMTENWVEHPYQKGVALLGDAAGASDPTWGQGLSLTLRDARVLSESLLADDDWERASNNYASTHDNYFQALLRIHEWLFDLFLLAGDEAEKRRARALPILATEPDRIPDHNFSGPELRSDDDVRRRFFGEA